MNVSTKRKTTFTNKPYKLTRPRAQTQKTKAENAKIRTIARKVILNAAETKLFAAQSTFNVSDNTAYAVNLNAPIVEGSTSVDRIGTKIQMRNIRLHYSFYSNPASGSTTKQVRVSVIKTPTRLTATAAAIAAADVFKQNTTTQLATAHFDLKKVKLLYDEITMVTPEFSGATVQTAIYSQQVQIPVNKSEVYETDTSTYIQSGNYYLIFTLYDGNVTYTPGGFNIAWTVGFKDE